MRYLWSSRKEWKSHSKSFRHPGANFVSFLVFSLTRALDIRFQALAKRTRKSTQVCKTGLACGLAKGGQTDSQVDASLQNRTCVRTCDGWPNELVSRHKSTNLRTNLWRNGFASRLASSRKSHKPYISRIYSWLAISLCRLALVGQTVKNLRTWSSTKIVARPRKVNASRWANETQVENLRWLTSTCRFVWPGL